MCRVVFILISFWLATALSQECKGGYHQFGQYCYGLVNMPQTWVEAQAACKSLGGFLAEPTNQQQDVFIKGVASLHDVTTVWLGGEDLMDEGKWFWSHSQTAVEEYTDWLPGEPNNIANNENCMNLYHNHWNDDNCEKKFPFICQENLDADVIG